MKVVRLVVGPNTLICDSDGNRRSVCSLKKGMIVNAEFSAAMTFSIPPQARAYKITMCKIEEPLCVKVGRVLNVDMRNCVLVTGCARDMNSQMKFVVTEKTKICDRCGNPCSLSDLRLCQMVKVEHSTVQTASIPPQTTACSIRMC